MLIVKIHEFLKSYLQIHIDCTTLNSNFAINYLFHSKEMKNIFVLCIQHAFSILYYEFYKFKKSLIKQFASEF